MAHSNQLIIIYFFSGTGNAFSVAKWIESKAIANNYSVQLYNLSTINRTVIPKPPENAMIGFISPTHGFNFPPIMFHFLLHFPQSARNSAFLINTRGGMKMSKYFLPGLSGMAQYLSAIILAFKGFKIIGMHPIDLPSNWISLHPGLKPVVVESIFKRRKAETERFASEIFNGKKDLTALKDIIQDVLITPIGVLYYFFGRFFLAKSFVATAKCDNCELCIKNCPVGAIKLVDKRPFWTYKCESCMQCMNECPKKAIETAHGLILGIYVLVNTFILFQLYKWLDFPSWYHSSIFGYLLSVLFDSAIFLGCLFISYRIFHYLKRFKLIETLITYTSFTRYSFWRRYQLSKLKFWRAYRLRKK
jgi:ferredoxin/flavodoxin